jgi:DNA mismatch repair protein MutS2
MTASADLLEFEAVKAILGRYVSSPAGHRKLEAVEPSNDRAALETILAETAEALGYHTAAIKQQPTSSRGTAVARLSFESLPDVEVHAAKLRVEGSVLDGSDIRDLTSVLDRACDVRAVLGNAADRFPRLGALAAQIADFRPLVNDLNGKIEPDGSVADNASVALHRVRREMGRQQALIQESLERFLRKHRDDGILQEEFVTFRNERFVLPVVAGQKRKVDGIIHAASGTGQTLFIEPLETVELNNDLVRLREQEMREVHRILQELTGRLRASIAEIRAAVGLMGDLELLFAKARFAVDFDCVIPVFATDETPRLEVRRARHPLLVDVLKRQRKGVVPLTLTLEGSTRTLLISGPNTGGKTVALKTIGVMVLMAQAGMPVPAEHAELPIFDQVLADIGDHQSLEQSLSTFSAHIGRIKQILETVESGSLVLIDELGRATDPDEGGALAVAVLDRVRNSGAFTLASTHLVAPKIYGATTPGVLNGAMSFDEQTLAPTYQLRTGTPGASAGLDIAQRLGLPLAVIDHARSTLTEEQQSLARLLKLLEERLDAATQRERELAELKRAIELEQRQLKEAADKREAAKLRELERRTEEMLAQFELRARETIDRLSGSTDQRKFVEHSQRKIAQAGREMRQERDTTLSAVRGETTPELVPVAEGVRVRLRGVREPARVRRLLANGILEVEAGFLRLQVAREDVLEVLPETPAAARLPKGVTVRTAPREAQSMASVAELNVIGRRVEEALSELDKFLDNAALADAMRVRIVHGHGMGVLKRAIGETLATHPHVAKYYGATAQEGGAGATIVELKSDR